MATSMQDDSGTGTRDETYDLVSTLYHALQGAEQCQVYAEDSQDEELRDFHQRSHQMHTQLADEAKMLLRDRLGQEDDTGGLINQGEQGSGTSSL